MYIASMIIKMLSELVTALFLGVFLKPKVKYLPLIVIPIVPVVFAYSIAYFGIISIRDPGLLRTILSLGCLVIVVLLLYEDKWKTKLFFTGIALTIQIISEFFSALPAALLYPEEMNYGTNVNGDVGITAFYLKMCTLFLIVSILLSLITIFIIKRIRHEVSADGIKYFGLFPLTQLILLLVLYIKSAHDATLGSALMWIVLSAICVVTDFGVYKALLDITKKARVEQAANFYKQQLEDQLAHYKAFSRYREELSHTRHDLANQTMVIQKLIDDRNYDETTKLMTQIQENVKELRAISFCEDKIVSALVYSKKQKMDDEGIAFESNLNIPEGLPIKAIDFCNVFSNILDNAIDAAGQVEDKPYIKIDCAISMGFLIIRCENTRRGEVLIDENGLPVSPNKNIGRGNGNEILREIAEKYHGEMDIDLSDENLYKLFLSLEI